MDNQKERLPFIEITLDAKLTIIDISKTPQEHKKEDFLNQKYTNFLAPKDSELFVEKAKEVMTTQIPQTFTYQAPADGFTLHHYQAHMSLTSDFKQIKLFLLDIENNPETTQQSDQKLLDENKTLKSRLLDIEKEFELQQRNYEIFVEQAPIAMYDIDLESRILTGNQKALDFFQLKGSLDFKKHFIFEFVHEKHREELEEKYTKATLGEEQYFTFESSHQDFQVFKSCFIPVYDFHHMIYKVFSLTEDISKEYLAEEILKKENSSLNEIIENQKAENQKKDQLIFDQNRHVQMTQLIKMIAHQWRQPLSLISTISGNVEVMISLGNIDKKSLSSSMKTINEQAQKLSKIISEFDEFYKPKRSKSTIHLKDLGDTVIEVLENSLTEDGIKLRRYSEGKTPFTTYKNEIIQVMINLIENAHEMLLERKITNPEIRLRGYETSLHHCIEISDNAEGIDETIMDKIFDPYFSTELEKNGTGLGLHMAKTMVESHCHGKLLVENSKKGATFTIQLQNEI